MMKKLLHRLLSPWFFLIYGLTGFFYFLLLILAFRMKFGTALFFTWGLLTGSDPFIFEKTLTANDFIWVGAWFIHTASWLFVPALIGYLLVGKIEEIKQDIKQDQQGVLNRAVALWVQGANVPEDKRQKTVDTLLAEITGEKA